MDRQIHFRYVCCQRGRVRDDDWHQLALNISIFPFINMVLLTVRINLVIPKLVDLHKLLNMEHRKFYFNYFKVAVCYQIGSLRYHDGHSGENVT